MIDEREISDDQEGNSSSNQHSAEEPEWLRFSWGDEMNRRARWRWQSRYQREIHLCVSFCFRSDFSGKKMGGARNLKFRPAGKEGFMSWPPCSKGRSVDGGVFPPSLDILAGALRLPKV